jgi:hypothetical protein
VDHELHELAHFGLKAVRFFLRVRHGEEIPCDRALARSWESTADFQAEA